MDFYVLILLNMWKKNKIDSFSGKKFGTKGFSVTVNWKKSVPIGDIFFG